MKWPQVKKWKIFSSWNPPRRLRLTREGRYFIAITFGVGFVGILTANNLLYVLLGVLLSLIIVSGILSEASLRHIRVYRRLPLRAQVGRAHLVEIEVHNDKKKMPSYAIEVEDLRAGQPADKRCFFLKVSAESSQIAAYRRVPVRRGVDQHRGFRVATRFPFGFFEKSRRFDSVESILVYPPVDPVRLPPRWQGDRTEGGHIASRGGGVDEIVGVRLMREGDDPRDIYWRRSTALSQKVVVERAREVRAQAQLLLENTFSGSVPSEEFLQRFEQKIREVASHAVAHLKRGDRVQLKTSSGLRMGVTPETGADPLLRFLALLQPVSQDAPEGAAPWQGPAALLDENIASSAKKWSVFPAAPQLSIPARPLRESGRSSPEENSPPPFFVEEEKP